MNKRTTVYPFFLACMTLALVSWSNAGASEAMTAGLTAGGGFSSWTSPTGEWVQAGDAFMKQDNKKLLGTEPGTGTMVNGEKGRTSHLFSRVQHGDVKAHIEFMVPRGSNSGVYFQGRYEIQVFDSWDSESNRPKTDPHHSDCGGIYQRWGADGGYEGRPPKVNACKAPGRWQTFDVIFRAPRFNDKGEKTENAVFVKVVHNGKVIHENESLTGPTRAAAFQDEKPLGPLMLQGDHGPVAYRNVRLEILGTDLEKQAAGVLPESMVAAVRSYSYGKSRKAIGAFEEKLKIAAPSLFGIVEEKLASLLTDSGATDAGKTVVCRILRRIGTGRSVAALGTLLADKKLSHTARSALQHNPSPKADAALKKALTSLQGELRIGVISSIGARGGCGAGEKLGELAASDDVPTAQAAVKALGRIGTKQAAELLEEADVPRLLKTDKANSLLKCADALRTKGSIAEAKKIYSALTGRLNPQMVRIAAHRGLLLTDPETATPLLLKMLKDRNEKMKNAAVTFLSEVHGSAITEAIGNALPDLPVETQISLLSVLAERGDAEALPAVKKAAASENEQLRTSALDMLGELGNASSVDFLISQMQTEGATARAAENALCCLKGNGIVRSITAHITKTDDREFAAKLIDVLCRRKEPESLEVMLALTEKTESTLSNTAFAALLRLLKSTGAKGIDNPEKLFKKVMARAGTTEEKRAVLDALTAVPAPWSLAFAQAYQKKEGLQKQADTAYKAIFAQLNNQVLVDEGGVLHAKDATVHGSGAAYEPADNRQCIGVWQNPDAYVTWEVHFTQSGTYSVAVSQSMSGSAGSTYTVHIGDNKLPGEVIDTGDWARFVPVPIGKATIKKPGTYTVAFKVNKKSRQYVINLRSINLKKQ